MFFVLYFIVHYLLHVSAPIGGHLQVTCNVHKIYIRVTTVYVNGSVESASAVDIHSGHPNIYFVYMLPEDGHRSGLKHVSSAQ
jgi:hypothetical protein